MPAEPVASTLLRVIIGASGLSRRKAFAAIRAGQVSVDGKPATDPSAPYRGGVLTLEGRVLEPGAGPRVYLMLNKPPGVITTVSDTHARDTVMQLVPVELRVRGLHPVGRLDKDTTGLLLLTNDGNLTFRLTHPGHEVEKEYWLRSRPALTERALEHLRAGIEIDGRVRHPVDVRRLTPGTGFEVSITIAEGRKRQVRRMLEAVGARATALTRVREGPLALGGLPVGALRKLIPEELRALGVESGGAHSQTRRIREGGASRGGGSRSRRAGRRR